MLYQGSLRIDFPSFLCTACWSTFLKFWNVRAGYEEAVGIAKKVRCTTFTVIWRAKMPKSQDAKVAEATIVGESADSKAIARGGFDVAFTTVMVSSV